MPGCLSVSTVLGGVLGGACSHMCCFDLSTSTSPVCCRLAAGGRRDRDVQGEDQFLQGGHPDDCGPWQPCHAAPALGQAVQGAGPGVYGIALRPHARLSLVNGAGFFDTAVVSSRAVAQCVAHMFAQRWVEGNTSFTLDELIRYDVFTQKDLIGDISGTASGEAQLEVGNAVSRAYPHDATYLCVDRHALLALTCVFVVGSFCMCARAGESEQDRQDVGRHQLRDQALP